MKGSVKEWNAKERSEFFHATTGNNGMEFKKKELLISRCGKSEKE